jgi:hypothetical protein
MIETQFPSRRAFLGAGIGGALTSRLSAQTPAEDAPEKNLERVNPPNGSDRLPYHLRDLGTIFFVQAAARLLLAS